MVVIASLHCIVVITCFKMEIDIYVNRGPSQSRAPAANVTRSRILRADPWVLPHFRTFRYRSTTWAHPWRTSRSVGKAIYEVFASFAAAVPPSYSATHWETKHTATNTGVRHSTTACLIICIHFLNQIFVCFCSIHVRRTDKVDREASFHPLEEYIVRAEEFFGCLDITRRRIFVASDDPSVIDGAKKN